MRGPRPRTRTLFRCRSCSAHCAHISARAASHVGGGWLLGAIAGGRPPWMYTPATAAEIETEEMTRVTLVVARRRLWAAYARPTPLPPFDQEP